MALFRVALSLAALALISSTLCIALPGFGYGFGWGGGFGGSVGGGGSSGLFPQFYQFSCPQVDEIVMSVLEPVIAGNPRMAASLLRLHFHDCFAQVRVLKTGIIEKLLEMLSSSV